MTRTIAGWVVFLAALGMMATLLAVDVSKFQSWADATTPATRSRSPGAQRG